MIFAPGAYTWGNKGDAALVTAFLRWLKEDFKAEEVELTSFTPAGDASRYGVVVHHMVVRPMNFGRRATEFLFSTSATLRAGLTRYRLLQAKLSYSWLPAWVRLYRAAPRIARFVGRRSLYTLTKRIDESRFVFTVPGGYLLAPRNVDDWWLYHVPNIRLGKLLGKKVILGPSSIGPFADSHKAAAARLLADVDGIIIREERSRQYLREAKVPESLVLRSPDIAFLHDPVEPSALGEEVLRTLRRLKSRHTGLVGVSVRHHTFPAHDHPDEMFRTYMDAISESLAMLSLNGAGIVLVSQTEEDVSTTQDLASLLRRRDVPFVQADPGLTPSDLQRLYGELDLLIGTRMHANILALTMGTPVVGIAYEPKTIGILESIGLEQWGLWIDAVGDGHLEALVDKAWASRAETRASVKHGTASIRDQFKDVAQLVIDRFEL